LVVFSWRKSGVANSSSRATCVVISSIIEVDD
jgi:hypothetical protein